MSEKYTLDELVTKTTEIIEEEQYKIKATKSPQKKRTHQYYMNFWKAINHHLSTYQSLLKDSTIS